MPLTLILYMRVLSSSIFGGTETPVEADTVIVPPAVGFEHDGLTRRPPREPCIVLLTVAGLIVWVVPLVIETPAAFQIRKASFVSASMSALPSGVSPPASLDDVGLDRRSRVFSSLLHLFLVELVAEIHGSVVHQVLRDDGYYPLYGQRQS